MGKEDRLPSTAQIANVCVALQVSPAPRVDAQEIEEALSSHVELAESELVFRNYSEALRHAVRALLESAKHRDKCEEEEIEKVERPHGEVREAKEEDEGVILSREAKEEDEGVILSREAKEEDEGVIEEVEGASEEEDGSKDHSVTPPKALPVSDDYAVRALAVVVQAVYEQKGKADALQALADLYGSKIHEALPPIIILNMKLLENDFTECSKLYTTWREAQIVRTGKLSFVSPEEFEVLSHYAPCVIAKSKGILLASQTLENRLLEVVGEEARQKILMLKRNIETVMESETAADAFSKRLESEMKAQTQAANAHISEAYTVAFDEAAPGVSDVIAVSSSSVLNPPRNSESGLGWRLVENLPIEYIKANLRESKSSLVIWVRKQRFSVEVLALLFLYFFWKVGQRIGGKWMVRFVREVLALG